MLSANMAAILSRGRWGKDQAQPQVTVQVSAPAW